MSRALYALTGLGLAGAWIARRRRPTIDEDRAEPAPAPTPSPSYGPRLTVSRMDRAGNVLEPPAELLAQARKRFPTLTLTEYTAARLAMSEWGRGPDVALQCIIDAELNRAEARGISLTEHLTSANTYGRQGAKKGLGRKRKAATSADPYLRHLAAARAVLAGGARGISQGARIFFDPVTQMDQHKKWLAGETDRRHCPPEVILARWSYNLDWNHQAGHCHLKKSRHSRPTLEWVGPIDGIDPLRLMLLRPATEHHREQYVAARALLVKEFSN